MAPVDATASGAEAQSGMLTVEVAVGMAPRQVARRTLALVAGATVREALNASGLLDQPHGPTWALIASGQWFVGIWGRRTELDHILRERDRVELYRGLNVDPKEARRVRYQAHAEKFPRGSKRAFGKKAP